MEEPELVYCEVINSEEDIQPPPPPLPQRSRENISASFLDVQNFPRRISLSPLQSMAIMTNNSSQRNRQNSSSKKQVLLSIAVAIFAILLAVFMTLYFTIDCPRNSLPNTSHTDVCQNYSIMSDSSNNTSDCKILKKDLEVKKLAYASLHCVECSEYSILFHRENTEDYIISKSAPRMTAITACFWVNTRQKTQDVVHYITYAVSKDEFGERDNEFGIGRRSTTLEFYVKYNIRSGFRHSSSSAKNIVINDGKWHAICGLGQKDGEVKIYNDGNLVHGEYGFKKSQTISGEGTWVLGQDQDTEGGKFGVNQMMQGEITEVNIWDRVLSDEEINSFSTSCQSRLRGNVKYWNDFTSGVKENAAFVQRPTCCNASTSL